MRGGPRRIFSHLPRTPTLSDLSHQLESALGQAFRVERELGGGGMSRVFLAEERTLGRRVVIKVLPPDLAASMSAERFQAEIRTVASLQHPNIVPLLAAGGSGDLLWFTMPYIEGEALRARLTRENELPIGDAVRIWMEMLDALSHAHARGLVHRDVKPENVLLSGRHAMIADFGVAKALASATGGAGTTATGLALGTPAYMAPEQAAADGSIDHRADLYAAGLVMWEMLTGRAPFADRTPAQQMVAHATTPIPPIRERRAQVSEALEDLVLKCCAKVPADRPRDANEVMAALAMVPDATPSGTSAARPAASGRHARGATGSRRRFAMLAIGFVAVLGVGFAARAPLAALLGPRPLAHDSLRLSVMILPSRAESADSVMLQTVERTIIGALRAHPHLRVTETREAPAMFGAGANRVSRDTIVSWLPDAGVHTHLTLSLVRAGDGFVVGATVSAVRGDSLMISIQEAATTPADVPRALARLRRETQSALRGAVGKIARPEPTGAFWDVSRDLAKMLQESFQAREAGDMRGSIEALRAVLRRDSTVVYAWRELGIAIAASGLGSTNERLTAFEMAYRTRHRVRFEVDTLFILQDYYREIGDLPRAIAAGEALERAAPELANPNNTAIAYSSARRFDDALRTYRRIMDTTYRRPVPANGNYIRSLIDVGRLAEAEREAAVLFDSMPGGRSTATARAIQTAVLVARRNYDSLEAVGRDRLAQPLSPDARNTALGTLATTYVTLGRFAEARRIEDETVVGYAAANRSAQAQRAQLLSMAHWIGSHAGDSTTASVLLDSAVRAFPLRESASLDRTYFPLATAYIANGRLRDARRVLDEADREIPSKWREVNAVAREQAWGDLAVAEGDARGALARYRASNRGGCVPCAYPRLAVAHDLAGNADSALVWYERYLDAQSHRLFGTDWVYLARSYERAAELHEARGDRAKAIARYEQLIALWRNADPSAQVVVQRARERVAALQRPPG